MVTYRHDAEGLTEEAVAGFFEGWPVRPSPATHLRLLRGSDVVSIAVEGERVVGFATAVTDGVLSACISFVEVRPESRDRGIGSELVRRVLAQLDGLYMIDTCCDDSLVSFYERFGMERGVAMMRRDYKAQAGREGRRADFR